MAWSDITSATQLTGVTTTVTYFDQEITLTPGETADVRVRMNFSSTDDGAVHIEQTLDATSEAWSVARVFTIANGDDNNWVSFPIFGVYKVRIGVVQSGSAGSATCDMDYRTNNVDL